MKIELGQVWQIRSDLLVLVIGQRRPDLFWWSVMNLENGRIDTLAENWFNDYTLFTFLSGATCTPFTS